MTLKHYLKRMKQHEHSFGLLWNKIVKDTNDFIEKNPNKTMYNLRKIENFSDYMCLSGAWFPDRINGKSGVPGMSNYRGSLTKKIRKALGFIS